MGKFEADRNSTGNSVLRYNRAMRLLRENYGQLTPELFQKLLADHAGYPTSICKHGTETVTVFSIIVQVEKLHAWIGRGRACETEYVEYHLQPYQPKQ
jgi:isopenicillin-N N-acyltransferase-like protein